jgi:hypothetical protein
MTQHTQCLLFVCFLLAACSSTAVGGLPSQPSRRSNAACRLLHMRIVFVLCFRRDSFVSHYFKRHFWWYECVLFPSSIPLGCASIVFAAEQDGILNTGTLSEACDHVHHCL